MMQLKKLRQEFRLSQLKVSRAIGIGRYKIHLLENLYAKPTNEEKRRIQKFVKTMLTAKMLIKKARKKL